MCVCVLARRGVVTGVVVSQVPHHHQRRRDATPKIDKIHGYTDVNGCCCVRVFMLLHAGPMFANTLTLTHSDSDSHTYTLKVMRSMLVCRCVGQQNSGSRWWARKNERKRHHAGDYEQQRPCYVAFVVGVFVVVAAGLCWSFFMFFLHVPPGRQVHQVTHARTHAHKRKTAPQMIVLILNMENKTLTILICASVLNARTHINAQGQGSARRANRESNMAYTPLFYACYTCARI